MPFNHAVSKFNMQRIGDLVGIRYQHAKKDFSNKLCCVFLQMFDPIIDDDIDLSCRAREYMAGITRISETRFAAFLVDL